MTVQRLIEELQKFDPQLPVIWEGSDAVHVESVEESHEGIGQLGVVELGGSR